MPARPTSALTALTLLLTASQLWRKAVASPAASPLVTEPLCYQKLSGAPTSLSIEQLRLQRQGQRITGTYNWIPWQKDRRLGRLEGREQSAGTARLTYRFSQEGQQASALLTVVFDGRQAMVRWDPLASQGQPLPPVRLPRSACAALKPVPGL